MLTIINMRYLSSRRSKRRSGPIPRTRHDCDARHHRPRQAGKIPGGGAIINKLPIQRILVFGRHPERRDEFIREMSQSIPRAWQKADTVAELEADIIVISTSSSIPIIEGRNLKEQVLVISIGANGWDKHEVSPTLIHSMDLIVTDDLASCHGTKRERRSDRRL